MRYRSRIPNPALIAPIGITVKPGQEFDSPAGLFHPELEPLDDEAKAHVAAIEAANAEHAARYAQETSGQGLVDPATEAAEMAGYRAALGLEPLPPTPAPTEEEARIRGLKPLQDTAAALPPATKQTKAKE